MIITTSQTVGDRQISEYLGIVSAAQVMVLAAGPRPGDRVLDVCAAPGGKSFAAAMAMEDRGEVIACDIHPHKLALIEKGAARLGLGCVRAE